MSRESIESLKSTEGMVDYNRNSTAQQQLVHLLSERIQGLVDQLDEAAPEFKIVDYGCGPGRSTVDTVKPAIAAYRKKFTSDPIAVCHADQSGNDWNTLFQIATGDTGYIRPGNGIRTEAAIGSFYDQVTASDSVSIGTCIFASHWLSHAVDIDAPGSVWFADIEGTARDKMDRFAQDDWTRFLRHRAAELHSGGYMLVGTLGSVPDATEINGKAASGRGIYRAIQRVAQGMVDDGLLEAEALDRFLFSLWFMTEEEAVRPLKSDPDLAKAFEVLEVTVHPAPFNAADVFGGFLDDPAEYAKKYVGYTRAFGDSTLRTQLFEPGAPDGKSADDLLAEFYRRLEHLYRTETNKYACEIWHLIVLLKKT